MQRMRFVVFTSSSPSSDESVSHSSVSLGLSSSGRSWVLDAGLALPPSGSSRLLATGWGLVASSIFAAAALVWTGIVKDSQNSSKQPKNDERVL